MFSMPCCAVICQVDCHQHLCLTVSFTFILFSLVFLFVDILYVGRDRCRRPYTAQTRSVVRPVQIWDRYSLLCLTPLQLHTIHCDQEDISHTVSALSELLLYSQNAYAKTEMHQHGEENDYCKADDRVFTCLSNNQETDDIKAFFERIVVFESCKSNKAFDCT